MTNKPWCIHVTIALLHDDVTIITFIKIQLLNARDHGRLMGTKQCKFTENHSKTSINSQREVEYFPNALNIIEHMIVNAYYDWKPDHFGFNCFARSKFCQIFYWMWRFYPLHKQTVMSSWSTAISCWSL